MNKQEEIPAVKHKRVLYNGEKVTLWYMNCKVFVINDRNEETVAWIFKEPQAAWEHYNTFEEISPEEIVS